MLRRGHASQSEIVFTSHLSPPPQLHDPHYHKLRTSRFATCLFLSLPPLGLPPLSIFHFHIPLARYPHYDMLIHSHFW